MEAHHTQHTQGNLSPGAHTSGAMREAADEVRHHAADIAGRAKEQGKTILAQQKEAAAGQVDSVASAFRSTARQLEDENRADVGRYVGFAAERLESIGRQLRDKDVDSLIGDAQDLARRSPVAFFGGSVIAGFLLARFIKSSADRRPTEYSRSEHGGEPFTGYAESQPGAGAHAGEPRSAGSLTPDAVGG